MTDLRPAQLSDIHFILQCMEELENEAFDRKRFGLVFEQAYYSEDYYPFIILSGEQPCGYLGIRIENQLHHNGKVAEILELIILPGFRNRSNGKEALDFAIHFALEQNCLLIELASGQTRIDAHRFYEFNGFKKSHYKFTINLAE